NGRKGRAGRAKRSSGGEGGTARRIGCAVIPIAVVTAIAFGIFGAVRSCDLSTATSSFDPFEFDSSKLTLSGSGTVLPSDGAGDEGDVVMLLQSTEDSETTRHVARIAFTGSRSELVWQSEALPDDSYRAEIALVGDTLFAGVDDDLYALDAVTGETRWKTTLRDKLTSGCDTCFSAVRGRLMIRTTDAYITAYGTRGSEQLWSKRLNSTQGSMSVVGDRLFVVDDGEAANSAVPATLVDPANGRTIRATTPRCPKGQATPWDLAMSAGDQVLPVPGSSDVFAAFGFGDGCVVRWTPETGAIKWTSRLDGLGSIDEDEVLAGERDLVIGTTGSPIVTVYLPNGKARVLGEPSGDVDAEPSQIVGRTLVALTVTTRGTPKGGMAAWDLATGERTWSNAALGTAQPAAGSGSHTSDVLFDGTPRSLLVPVGDGLNVFVFEGTERTFSVSPLDLATGELGTEVRRAFSTRYDSGSVSLTVEGQTGDRLIVSVDNLLQSLPVSGKGDVVSYPEKN
ncbi:MAG: PQQ-like domain, partial [Ilumatobacteraceae bacterium]|nr:PQQ-like domain [Ilumatobacteraceae bacterium]